MQAGPATGRVPAFWRGREQLEQERQHLPGRLCPGPRFACRAGPVDSAGRRGGLGKTHVRPGSCRRSVCLPAGCLPASGLPAGCPRIGAGTGPACLPLVAGRGEGRWSAAGPSAFCPGASAMAVWPWPRRPLPERRQRCLRGLGRLQPVPSRDNWECGGG